MRTVLIAIIILVAIAPLGTMAQVLSFEYKHPDLTSGVGFGRICETPDSGFLVVTLESVTKLNKKGETDWRYYIDRTKSFYTPSGSRAYPFGFGSVRCDNDAVYVGGFLANSNGPYHIVLTHDGDYVSDTAYAGHWAIENPFYGTGSRFLVGDYIQTFGNTWINLQYDSIEKKYTWDNICLFFQKIHKFTGERSNFKISCLSNDSAEFVRGAYPLNTADKGYILHVVYENLSYRTSAGEKDLLVRIDSAGNVLKVVDMFDSEFFEGFDLSDLNLDYHRSPLEKIKCFYSTNLLNENLVPLTRLYDTAGIGIYLHVQANHNTKGSGNWFIFIDSNLMLLDKTKYEFEKKNMEKIFRELENDTISFYTKHSDSILWKKQFFKPNPNIFINANSWGLTKFNGLIRTYITGSGISPMELIIQHIGPHGWPFGYDPDAPIPPPWNEADSLHIFAWFDNRGNMVVPSEVRGWKLVLSNTIGQEVLHTTAPEDGKLPLPPNIRPGVYFIRFHSPHTGKVYYYKTAKQF